MCNRLMCIVFFVFIHCDAAGIPRNIKNIMHSLSRCTIFLIFLRIPAASQWEIKSISEICFRKLVLEIMLVGCRGIINKGVLERPCTVLFSTVQHCSVLHSTVQYCSVLFSTVLYCTVLYCTVLYCQFFHG